MDDETPAKDPVEQLAADASAPDVLDLAAEERDLAALDRDEAAEDRDTVSAGEAQRAAEDRTLAKADRAAAALDRQEAASDRRTATKQLQNTYRDDLTGTLARDAGREQLSHAVDRAHRDGAPLVIAYLDVDHLKEVNDAHGHAAGDGLLRKVGSSLRRGLRSYDVVVRNGGDEFICALPGCHLAEAERRFTDVGKVLSRAIAGASVSVGLAELRREESVEEVIARADREMYDHRRTHGPGSGAT